jgi:hypothetical protein
MCTLLSTQTVKFAGNSHLRVEAISATRRPFGEVSSSPVLSMVRDWWHITYHMTFGLKHNIAALNRTFHPTVHNHPLSGDTSDDLSVWRGNKRCRDLHCSDRLTSRWMSASCNDMWYTEEASLGSGRGT